MWFATILVVLASASADKLTSADRLWLASVDHLITKAERQQYESFDADGRRRFEENFWVSRDPDPSTPQNEAHEEHLKRLHFVEQHLQENEVPGVLTERGRVYLKFGAPQYRKMGNLPATANGSISASRRDWAGGDVPVEIWVYDHPPAANPGKYRVMTFVDENGTNRYGILNDEQRPLQKR